MANNPFDEIAVQRPRYSTFDLSHDHKTSLKMGKLIPILVQEALPGDRFTIKHDAMFRMMPMIAPIMHRVDVTTHTFFVPNRICWDNWEKYITGGETIAGTATPPAHPYINFNDGVQYSSLANYIGVPANSWYDERSIKVNALPFMAYQKIFHEYYRDQNLQVEPEYKLQDGDNFALFAYLNELRDRAWEHDYFTSCLPSAQKGEAVELPLDFQDTAVKWRNQADSQFLRAPDGSRVNFSQPLYSNDDGEIRPVTSTEFTLDVDPNGTLYIDGEDMFTTTTINDLRTAWSLQQFLEKNMRAGSRYKEALQSMFGVRSPDARLQRPEYLGGSKSTMAISEVLQTSSSDATTPQANMAGHGISVNGSAPIYYRCLEHGYVITVLSITPKTAYFQGLPRFLQKGNIDNAAFTDRTCYAFPDFAQLGEQEVFNSELYVGNDDQNEDVFGYIPRYAEYRYNPSRVSGEMANTLDFWHMARKFDNRPTLNYEFIQCNPTRRIFAVEDEGEDTIVAHFFMYIKASRPLPVYGIPAPLV